MSGSSFGIEESDFLPLIESDFKKLDARFIDRELAGQARLFRVNSFAGALLVNRNGNEDYGGVVIPNVFPGQEKPREYRLRRDHPEIKYDGERRTEINKYLSASGARNNLYFVPGTRLEWLADKSLPIVFTEGEFKALALYRAAWHGLGDSAERPHFLPIGLYGVNSYRGTIGKELGPDGARLSVKGLLPDFQNIDLQTRRVVVLFDTNVRVKEPIRQARKGFTKSLEGLGSLISWFAWPEDTPESVNGVDDYLAIVGPEKVLELIDGANGQEEETPRNHIIFARDFLTVVDPPIEFLINELIPSGVIALPHGEPRTKKSWAALEIAVALATGKPAFGLERFSIPRPLPVLYSSQEDDARRIRDRVKRLLLGKGFQHGEFPETLAFSVHAGIDLERYEWQRAILRDIERFAFALIILDPIRRFAPSADKGPAEVRLVTAFLRKICIETSASVLANHHDVKPNSQVPDIRRRGHKASGGDWFASAECPIAFESAGENRTLVVPEDFKFGVDPDPFTFTIEEDIEKTWARLVGETRSKEEASDLAESEKVLEYVRANPGKTGNAISKGCRIRRELASLILQKLFDAGRVDCVPGSRKSHLWFIKE